MLRRFRCVQIFLKQGLDESVKSSRTCPLPTKPAVGSLKGSSPRPAVQKTIVNFFYDATVARSTSKETAAEKRGEKRQQEVQEAASPLPPAAAFPSAFQRPIF